MVGWRIVIPIALIWALLGTGCWKEVDYQSRRIPLEMAGVPTNQKSVAVSMVLTTGWVHMLVAVCHPESVKTDHVERCFIEFVDERNPTLFVPEDSTWLFYGWLLTFVKSDFNGFAVFSPGVDPMFYGTGQDNGAGLRLTYSNHTDGPNYPVAALAKPHIVGTTAPPPYMSSTEPSTSPAVQTAWHQLLNLTNFWDQMQCKYAWGQSRQEIRLICQTIVQAVGAYTSAHPEHRWSAQQERNIRLCRDILKRR